MDTESQTSQMNTSMNSFDSFSSQLYNVEIADDFKRAIISIPLMHEGANKKGLFWTQKMLKEVVPLFRAVPFRYDLEGKEGSSHATRKLSSPFFDIGWVYSDERGAWYDDKTKTVWVQGEVTHPDVIAKLSRETTDGMREVNYASMGVMVEKAKCSVCGADWIQDTDKCENSHNRMERYESEICYKVPTECSKGLHVALTNNPADGESVIANCVFQELHAIDKYQSKIPKAGDYQMVPTEVKDVKGGKFGGKDPNSNTDDKVNPHQQGGAYNHQQRSNELTNSSGHETKRTSGLQNPDASSVNGQQQDQYGSQTNTMPNGMAGDPGTSQQFSGPAPSPDLIMKDLAERIKTIENKMGTFQGPEGTSPELVNASPQDRFSQDNMGMTEQFKGNDALGRPNQDKQEDGKMDVKDAQSSNAKTPVNPKPELQDGMGDPMGQVVQMLQEILNRLPGQPMETQDMGKEAQSAQKGMMKHDEENPTDHQAPGDSAGSTTDEGAQKNRANMNKPGMVATADDAPEPAEDAPKDGEDKPEEEKEDKEKKDLKAEVADMQNQLKQMRSSMEAADTTVPEFGAGPAKVAGVEAADMSANDRHEKFGDFGKWDACFNGSKSASKFGGK